jgi:uncharacterized membrane protein YhaH (DUF805 family)
MNWYLSVLKRYVDFNGRARRKEFWMFTLISVIIGAILTILDNIIGTTYGDRATSGVLASLYNLAVLLPTLGVGVRRLHDTGRSGWWILIGLVPLVGLILLIVWYATEGAAGPNQHGPDPKAAERAAGFPGGEPPLPAQ